MLVELTLPDNTACPIHVHQWGEDENSPVLFCVHGLTRHGLDFDKLAHAAASQGFRVIAPDMPGRGKSPPLANLAFYNNAINASLCAQLLMKLAIANVYWVGTSMGGIIALLLANQMPGVIRKLVLNDVGCLVPVSALQRIKDYASDITSFATYDKAEEALAARTATFGIPQSEWELFAKNSIMEKAGRYHLAYDPAILTALSPKDIAEDISLWPLWEAIKPIPTLLIRGEQSDLLSEEIAGQMQASHPNLTRYNVANAGHAPSLLSDAEINTILGFVA